MCKCDSEAAWWQVICRRSNIHQCGWFGKVGILEGPEHNGWFPRGREEPPLGSVGLFGRRVQSSPRSSSQPGAIGIGVAT